MTPEERELRRALAARSERPSAEFRARLSTAIGAGRPAAKPTPTLAILAAVLIAVAMVAVLLFARQAARLAPPTGQYGLREARSFADNLLRVVEGRDPKAFRYRNRGQVVSLGMYRGVATAFRFQLRGFPAWALARSYHLLQMPTVGRKARIAADWTVGLFFPRDITQLGSLQHPREPFRRAAGDG